MFCRMVQTRLYCVMTGSGRVTLALGQNCKCVKQSCFCFSFLMGVEKNLPDGWPHMVTLRPR